MILHAFLVTALFASLPAGADSVRVPKVGTVRPDSSVITALPAPKIVIPAPSSVPATVATVSPLRSIPMIGSRPGDDVQQTGAATRVAVISPARSIAPSTPAAVPVAAPADASAVAPASRPAAASIVTTPAPAAAPVTTADGRLVLGVKSTVTVAPLYAVPLPPIRARAAPPVAADSIVVDKRERRLTLYYRSVPVKSYFVALGAKPVGDKERAGDQRTPEGLFYVNAHNPASKFHLALRISYPSAAHRARAEAIGADPGGDIMIHGLPLEYKTAGREHLRNDWTNGCVALTNEEIEEIWRIVPDGTPVHIKP